jgi:uncharacterized protein YqgV (UPF0045/DUF77 family)
MWSVLDLWGETIAYMPRRPTDTDRILAAIANLKHFFKERIREVATLEEQIQAATTAIAADMQTLATDLAAIASSLTPGATVTQADVDALNAVVTAAQNVVTTANTMASPSTGATGAAAP